MAYSCISEAEGTVKVPLSSQGVKYASDLIGKVPGEHCRGLCFKPNSVGVRVAHGAGGEEIAAARMAMLPDSIFSEHNKKVIIQDYYELWDIPPGVEDSALVEVLAKAQVANPDIASASTSQLWTGWPVVALGK